MFKKINFSLFLILMIISRCSYCYSTTCEEIPWYIQSIKAPCIYDDIDTGSSTMIEIIEVCEHPCYAIANVDPLKRKVLYSIDVATPVTDYSFGNNKPDNSLACTHTTGVAGLIVGSCMNLEGKPTSFSWLSPWITYFTPDSVLVAGVAPEAKIVYLGTKYNPFISYPHLYFHAYHVHQKLKEKTSPDRYNKEKHVFNPNQRTTIVNVSMAISLVGDSQHKTRSKEEWEKFFNNIKHDNILLVIGAGNLGDNTQKYGINLDEKHDFILFPQEAEQKDQIILIAATDKDKKLSYFSNYGKTLVDIAAPGEDISLVDIDNKGWVHSGTSYSAPLVSGTLALGIGCNPTIDANKLKKILLEQSTKYEHLRKYVKNGNFLNVDSFVEKVCFEDNGSDKGEEDVNDDSSKSGYDDNGTICMIQSPKSCENTYYKIKDSSEKN